MIDRSAAPANRRRLQWGGVLLVAVFSLASWLVFTPPKIDRDRVYRIGFGNDAPLHFPDAEGNPTGLAVELVQAAADRAGIKLEWINLTELGGNDADFWVLKSIIPDSPSTLYNTEPYLQAESCFLVREDSPVVDLPDLLGHRISYVDYRVHRETLPRLLASFQAVPTASSRDAVDAMISGEADAAYIDQYTLFSTLLSQNQQPLRVLPTRSPTRDMALAARHPQAAVADEIRRAMHNLVEDGRLAHLMQKWIFFPNMTANIIGDIAREQRRVRLLVGSVSVLAFLLLVTAALAILAQRRKNRLQRSERDYRDLHESMTDAYVRFDPNDRIEGTNPAFCDLLGYSHAELIGLTDRDLTPSQWHPIESILMQTQVLPRGYSEVYEKQYRHRNGTVFPVETRIFLLRDSHGHPTGRWSIVRDITERKSAEAEREHLQQQLTQAQKMEVVGRLAGGVAHDFNNMLQAILGNASLALLESPPPAVRESLEEIRTSAERSADLTRQLLTFARRQAIAPRPLDLNATIENTLKLLRRLIGEGIELIWEPSTDDAWVCIDPSQLDQILTNLCINARDALDGAGLISLETHLAPLDATFCASHPGTLPGDYVELRVSDNGCGIDEENLKHLFEPFFTTKETGKGTGLGLATVYGIARQNQGAVLVNSQLGHGSIFQVFLPRHTPTERVASTNERPVASPERGHETILLVEDEEPVLRVAQRLLDSLGYQVLTATNAEDAIAIARLHADQIDLLVTDVIMPGSNGRELAEIARRIHPRIRCVFMSGYDANVIAPHGVLQSDVRFLQKPFSTDQLAAVVRQALA